LVAALASTSTSPSTLSIHPSARKRGPANHDIRESLGVVSRRPISRDLIHPAISTTLTSRAPKSRRTRNVKSHQSRSARKERPTYNDRNENTDDTNRSRRGTQTNHGKSK
ncbi:unnamed protein product, partial [Ectocarpus sp. 12 AP-2014]